MKKIGTLFLLLICGAFFLSGCSQLPMMSTPTPMPPVATQLPMTNEPNVHEAESNVKGTIIESRELTNEIGGYYIPIPDSWLGKTSYEFYADETYIYHITSDTEERVVNPILLHVGAAYDVEPTNLYTSAEVFLQLDDVKFYSIPVFDFPYTQGTADGNDYESFYSDIPMILQSVWVIDESRWGELNQPQWSPFINLDATIDGIMLGNSKQTVLDNLSSAYVLQNIETQEWDAIGATAEIYTYDFGTLTFLDDEFTGAVIYSSVLGPRGFGVGDNISDIVASFSGPAEYTFNEYTVYYRQNAGDADQYLIVPPSCYTYDDGTSTYFHADCFQDDSILTSYTMSELKEYFIYESQYSFTFFYDATGTVTNFSVYLGAPAE